MNKHFLSFIVSLVLTILFCENNVVFSQVSKSKNSTAANSTSTNNTNANATSTNNTNTNATSTNNTNANATSTNNTSANTTSTNHTSANATTANTTTTNTTGQNSTTGTNNTADNITKSNNTEKNSTGNSTKSTDETSYPSLFYKINLNDMIVNMNLGNPYQAVKLMVSTVSPFSWVLDSKCAGCDNTNAFDYRKSNSAVVKKSIVQLERTFGKLIGLKMKETLNLDKTQNNTCLKNYSMLQIRQSSNAVNLKTKPSGELSLAYSHPSNEDYLLLHSLKQQKKIPKRIFAIEGLGNSKANLSFGKYPESFNSTDVSSCRVLCNEGLSEAVKYGWVCKLSHMSQNTEFSLNNSVSVNDSIVFSTVSPYISAPYKAKEMFKDLLSSCTERKLKSKIHLFFCPKNFTSTKPLTFVFNGTAYSIPAHNLFMEHRITGEKFFNVVFQDIKAWILGKPFLKNFNVVFDRELSRVSFNHGIRQSVQHLISEETSMNISFKSWFTSNKFYIMIVVAIISVLIILMIAFFIMKTHKNKIRDNDEKRLVDEPKISSKV